MILSQFYLPSIIVTFLSKIHLYIQTASSQLSLWMDTKILQEHAASIFRIKFLVLFDPEDRGSMFL
jgi:hypothetical protein